MTIEMPDWRTEHNERSCFSPILRCFSSQLILLRQHGTKNDRVDKLRTPSDHSVKQSLQTAETFNIVCEHRQQPARREHHELLCAIASD